jgi:hypothetical protein
MAIGAELAVYHIERGARKFAALAKNIANDLDVSVERSVHTCVVGITVHVT